MTCNCDKKDCPPKQDGIFTIDRCGGADQARFFMCLPDGELVARDTLEEIMAAYNAYMAANSGVANE
jgi:hypothetical protein